ncbi:ankyrin repeat and SOCS box protein 3-like isoform X2 [Lampris incognitus]|uniref:ankyrin repeat and SOCS box protein 3-like isoform X2 n=1 Tax=Lampris incognitus TaxID=2546036 RepID=UPI0024B4D2DD|nr:ankyrin repeat and SOCS box protein 3-like isoform X2 [Lampris incognitus]
MTEADPGAVADAYLLHRAAREGKRDLLRTLMRNGHSQLSTDGLGRSPLHEAAEAGNIGCIRELLSKFCCYSDMVDYVNKKALQGCNAMSLAAAKGHVDIVKLLLNAGSKINIKDGEGLTPLHHAVSNCHLDMVKVLIRKGADVNATNFKHRSCLHDAVALGLSEIVRILVPLCHLELRDNKQKTALFLAARKDSNICLEILADAGACVNTQLDDCTTPLMAATKNESEACVKTLLRHNANPNIVCSRLWPKLPIHTAAKLGNGKILKSLIDVTDRNIDHRKGMVSPVYEAVENPQMLDLLLKEGFNPNGQDCKNVYDIDSPLALALSYAVDELIDSRSVELLVEAGALVTKDSWDVFLIEPEFLSTLLEHRQKVSKEKKRTELFTPKELKKLQRVAAKHDSEADDWLPTLLTCGLDPSLFLLSDLFLTVDGKVLNYLLDFVNWSTLSQQLKEIMEQRLKSNTWTPHPHQDPPSVGFRCVDED